MPFDSDVALLGTGVAPLVAAIRLMSEGKSVLLLNPDWDFFGENSELPLDPLWPTEPGVLNLKRVSQSLPDQALAELRPDFPGAIELWPKPAAQGEGFRDVQAPHVRSRSRLWIQGAEQAARSNRPEDWETVEAMYVEAADGGLNPQILDGLRALKPFPGFSSRATVTEDADGLVRGVLLPKLCDVDVSRYRNGLLEFVRERLDSSRILNAVTQLDLIPEGVKFHSGGAPHTARLKDGLLVFWTPRLTSWVMAQAKKAEVAPKLPRGVRLWEEWTLVSRESLSADYVGMFEDMTVWADVEGLPPAEGKGMLNRLSVLRAGSLLPSQSGINASEMREARWASNDSFQSISRLCLGFLKWDRISVRSMVPRAIFEWESAREWSLSGRAHVIGGCDGPLMEVVRSARAACERVKS